MDKFGDEVSKVEWRNEDRLTDYCGQNVKGNFIHCPKDTIPYVESRTSIRNFIKHSRGDPSWGKYIISQMPDQMGAEWSVPAFFNCGKRQHKADVKKDKPWMTQMYENNFWYLRIPPDMMGTSTIHYDMNHQIMCLVAGKKEWIMWDMQTEEKKIPMWNDYYRSPKKGRPQGSDDSPVDGERVDLVRYPKFAEAKWVNTTMEKGDCLFTPAHMLHYVRSWSDDEADDGRSIALMTMFQTEETYDEANCIDPPSHVLNSEFDTMWGEFPGSMDVPRCMNHIKMGYPNWKRTLKQLANHEVDQKGFLQFWQQMHGRYPQKAIQKYWKRFSSEKHQGSWGERIFASKAIQDLAKDMSCAQQGHSGPEKKTKDDETWNFREEYALAGGRKGYTDEQHSEL